MSAKWRSTFIPVFNHDNRELIELWKVPFKLRLLNCYLNFIIFPCLIILYSRVVAMKGDFKWWFILTVYFPRGAVLIRAGPQDRISSFWHKVLVYLFHFKNLIGFGLTGSEITRGSVCLFTWLSGFYFTSCIPTVTSVLPFGLLGRSSVTSY